MTAPIDLDRLDAHSWDSEMLAAACPQLAAELRAARAELAAVDSVIGDRGVPERNCTLPLPERVDNIIVELKNWRHECATEAAANEKLRAENERLTGIIRRSFNYLPVVGDNRMAFVDSDIEPHVVQVADEFSIISAQVMALKAENERLRAVLEQVMVVIDGSDGGVKGSAADVWNLACNALRSQDAIDAAAGGA